MSCVLFCVYVCCVIMYVCFLFVPVWVQLVLYGSLSFMLICFSLYCHAIFTEFQHFSAVITSTISSES